MCRDALQRAMAQFATSEYLQDADQNGSYPYEIYRQWAAIGLFRIGFPPAYGGAGGDLHELVQIAQDLSYWSHDLYTAYGIVLSAGLRLLRLGTEAQKQRWLPPLLAGAVRLSTSISEPAAGSDVAALETWARRAPAGWVLNGHKLWSSAAGAQANVLQVLARTGQAADAMTLFLVPNDAAGVELRKLDTLGRRATGSYEVLLDEVLVPDEYVLGEMHEGWSGWQECLPTDRLLASAGYVGSAQRVVDLALAHARERHQFGRPIGDFQVIAHMLVDMQTQVDASRLLVERACTLLQAGEDGAREVAMAKLFCSETYASVANEGMQVFGSHGYLMDCEMQRHFRDARSATTTNGSSQRQRNAIAAAMGLHMH